MKFLYNPFAALLILSTFLSQGVHAQIINLFAGTHVSGYTGNNGPATAAECFAPAGIAADAAGNVYISDLGNSVIRKVTPDGVIHTIAGTGVAGFGGDSGPASAALLNQPTSVTVDQYGNVFFTDDNNNRVRKIDLSGNISTVAGNGFAGYGGDGFQATSAELNSPTGVAVDHIGNIYIADANNQLIRRVDTAGIITLFAGSGTAGYGGDGGYAGGAALNYPSGVAVDTLGNVYIVDRGNAMIRKVFPTGYISRYAGDTTISGAPSFGFGGDGGLSDHALLNSPTEAVVAPDGSLYFADYNNHRIRKIMPNGSISTYAGNGTSGYSGNGGNAADAELAGPYGVAVDNTGKVYLTDEINNVAQVIGAPNEVKNIVIDAGLSVYPNPSSGVFNIEIPQLAGAFTVVITDVTGHVIESKNGSNSQAQKMTFTLSDLPAGTYLLSVNTAAKTYRQKVAVW